MDTWLAHWKKQHKGINCEPHQTVQRGVELLDETYPDWRDEIRLQEFSFWNTCKCVVGFLNDGEYTLFPHEQKWGKVVERGKEIMREDPNQDFEGDFEIHDDFLTYFGFDYRSGYRDEDGDTLHNLWLEAIQQ